MVLIGCCPVCGTGDYRFVRERPESTYLASDGVEVLDQGIIGICRCDPRWDDARLFGALDPFNAPRGKP